MVQLSNDCMAFDGALLSVEQALERIKTRKNFSLESQEIPLVDAVHRICAQDYRALSNSPAFNNSAVDGYAVCLSEDPEEKAPQDKAG